MLNGSSGKAAKKSSLYPAFIIAMFDCINLDIAFMFLETNKNTINKCHFKINVKHRLKLVEKYQSNIKR